MPDEFKRDSILKTSNGGLDYMLVREKQKTKDRKIIINLLHAIHFYVTDGNIMYLTDASRSLISCVIQHYAPVVGWGCGGTDA